MKKTYEMPDAKLVKIATEDIMELSLNSNTEGEGVEISWESWT